MMISKWLSFLKKIPYHWLLPILLVALAVLGWFLAPPGLLGKMDAIGYAVCHRIIQRSFTLGDRPLPLCARCTGMHLGAFFGLLYMLRRGKRGSLPTLKFLILFGLSLVIFGLDGINSYINLIHIFPTFYTTENWMRLFTGTFLGLAMAGILYPIFNQSIWADWIEEPILYHWKQWGTLLFIGSILILVVLSENPIFLYPLAILSALNILIVLTLIYTIIWVMLTKRDNSIHHFGELKWFLMGGLITSLIQIGMMDYARFLFTGSWNGLLS